ncbi:MAG: hypothetical protein ACTHJG_00155 [Rhodanobacteraceae bacterium]
MADYYYGLNLGDNVDKAVVSDAPTGKDIELRSSTAVTSRTGIEVTLRSLENFILMQPYPPL